MTAVVALMLAGAQLASASAQEADTVESYLARVSDARDAAMRAARESMSAGEALELAEVIDERLPRSERVTVAGGQPVLVDNSILSSLTARLGAADSANEREAVLAEIRRHLSSLERSIGQPGDVPPHDPEALARAVGAHRADRRSPFTELFGELVERIIDWFGRWWAAVGGSPGGGAAVRTVVIAVLVAMALFLVVAIARMVVRARRGTARAVPAAAGEIPDDGDIVAAAAAGLPGDPLAHAEQLAARGAMRDALRALFGGAVREVAGAGYVVQARCRTNSELLLEIRPRSEQVYQPLSRLSRVFERVWYGHHELDAADFAGARDEYLGVLAALGQDGGVE